MKVRGMKKIATISVLTFISCSAAHAADYVSGIDGTIVCPSPTQWRAATFPADTPERVKAAGCRMVARGAVFQWSGQRQPFAEQTPGTQPSVWAQHEGQRVVVNPNLLELR